MLTLHPIPLIPDIHPPPSQREVASAEALELSLHGMEAKLFVGTGATASASSPGAGHPHALSGSPSRLEVSIHGLHGSHRPAGPLPQRQHRRAAAFSPNTIIVSPQGFRGLRDGGEQGKDSGGPGWKRGWGSVRMRGILRGLTGLVSQLRHATGKAEEREPDFFHLVRGRRLFWS